MEVEVRVFTCCLAFIETHALPWSMDEIQNGGKLLEMSLFYHPVCLINYKVPQVLQPVHMLLTLKSNNT